MFTKIIVPLDGSELAQQMAPYAAGLAQSLLIPLELLHVVNPAAVQPRDGSDHVDGIHLDETYPHVGEVQAPTEITHKGYLDQARAVSMYALAPVPAGPGVFLPTDADGDARTYLDTRVHSLCVDRVDTDGIVLRGDAGMEIVRLAETSPDSMVLMTTHGRSGIPRMVLGSVAEDIVRRSSSPVLVLRATD